MGGGHELVNRPLTSALVYSENGLHDTFGVHRREEFGRNIGMCFRIGIVSKYSLSLSAVDQVGKWLNVERYLLARISIAGWTSDKSHNIGRTCRTQVPSHNAQKMGWEALYWSHFCFG